MKTSLRSLLELPTKLWVTLLIALLLGIGGFIVGNISLGNSHDQHDSLSENKTQIWTCSMHPQIRQPEPGKCPICGMDLIPATQEEDGAGERQLVMSPAAMKLAEVETQPAVRRFIDVEVPLSGKVDFDETRVKTISAWVGGRLERLFVDYTGVPVKKGEHLVQIYSPELFAAQEELLQAIGTAADLQDSASEYIKKSSADTVAAVREKLSLLGLQDEQIANIEKQKAPSALMEITSPMSGIVIHKDAQEGMYVKTGSPIYTVADLSQLWIKLDAYESDLPWIKYGQTVDIRAAGFGDKSFPGRISFIDPVLNPETRTVKVRAVVDNPEGLLRPNMFVKAIVRVQAGEYGAVATAGLDGKLICPMHPEVIADKAGPCTICGMDLVKAETLGYASKLSSEAPLVVPSSAVLITGKRALIYVRLTDKEKPTFEGREVTLGPRAGDYYIIRSGLNENEDVVVNGSFKIDSALQLSAKPSMMSPQSGQAPQPHHIGQSAVPEMQHTAVGKQVVPESFSADLGLLLKNYFAIHKALAGDNPAEASKAAEALAATTSSLQTTDLAVDAEAVCKEQQAVIETASKTIREAESLQKQREALPSLTSATETLLSMFGPVKGMTARKAFCPMAFDNKGAFWLQEGEVIENPYFGSAMPRCGEIKGVLSAPNHAEGDGHEQH